MHSNRRRFCWGLLPLVGFMAAAAASVQAASPYLEGCMAEQIDWQKHRGELSPSHYRIEKYCSCIKAEVQNRAMPAQVDELDDFPNHKPRWLLTLEGQARPVCEPLLKR